jgi:N-methylhydantoinase A
MTSATSGTATKWVGGEDWKVGVDIGGTFIDFVRWMRGPAGSPP